MSKCEKVEKIKICAGNNKQVKVTKRMIYFFFKKEETWKDTRGFIVEIMRELAIHVKEFELNHLGNGK